MRTIVIAGAHSSIGKTLLAEELLQGLSDWSALKVTVKRKSGCPRDKSNCNICAKLKGNFEIIKDTKIINQEGRDTARLKKAGAKKVIWLVATLRGLKRGLKEALNGFKNSKGIVIEGTSVIKYIKPDLLIFIRADSGNLRYDAREALKKADIVI